MHTLQMQTFSVRRFLLGNWLKRARTRNGEWKFWARLIDGITAELRLQRRNNNDTCYVRLNMLRLKSRWQNKFYRNNRKQAMHKKFTRFSEFILDECLVAFKCANCPLFRLIEDACGTCTHICEWFEWWMKAYRVWEWFVHFNARTSKIMPAY